MVAARVVDLRMKSFTTYADVLSELDGIKEDRDRGGAVDVSALVDVLQAITLKMAGIEALSIFAAHLPPDVGIQINTKDALKLRFSA